MWLRRVPILLFVIVKLVIAEGPQRYDGYHLLRTVPKTDKQVTALVTLQNDPKLEFWVEPWAVGQSVNIFVGPENVSSVTNYLTTNGLETEIIFNDADKLIRRGGTGKSEFGWQDYHTLETINDWLNEQAGKYSEIVSVVTAGKSFEGRDLVGLRIAYQPDLPVVFVEAGIHAREWIAPATATWIIQQVLNTTSDLIKSFEWHIFPVVNPDGYVFTHTEDRLWRKNRNVSPHTPHTAKCCIGVDLNRNFPFMWRSEHRNLSSGNDELSDKKVDAQSPTCRNDYAGPAAASEPEVKGLVKYLSTVANRTKVFFSLHSYGQILTFPYAYIDNRIPTKDAGRVEGVAATAVKAVVERSGTWYGCGQSATTFNKTYGTSLDYAYSINVTFAYSLKMRDRAKYGFLLPKEDIVSAAGEAFDILNVILEESNNLTSYPRDIYSPACTLNGHGRSHYNSYGLIAPSYRPKYEPKQPKNELEYQQVYEPRYDLDYHPPTVWITLYQPSYEMKYQQVYEPNYGMDYEPYYEPNYQQIYEPKYGVDYQPFYETKYQLIYEPKYGVDYEPFYEAKYQQIYEPKYGVDYEPSYETKYQQIYEPKYGVDYEPSYETKYQQIYEPKYGVDYEPSCETIYQQIYEPKYGLGYDPSYSWIFSPAFASSYIPSYDSAYSRPFQINSTICDPFHYPYPRYDPPDYSPHPPRDPPYPHYDPPQYRHQLRYYTYTPYDPPHYRHQLRYYTYPRYDPPHYRYQLRYNPYLRYEPSHHTYPPNNLPYYHYRPTGPFYHP